MGCAFKKLKSRRGESLVETLCTVLITTLSALVLVTAIMTASKINTETKKKIDAMYDAANTAEELFDESRDHTADGEDDRQWHINVVIGSDSKMLNVHFAYDVTDEAESENADLNTYELNTDSTTP